MDLLLILNFQSLFCGRILRFVWFSSASALEIFSSLLELKSEIYFDISYQEDLDFWELFPVYWVLMRISMQ